MSPQEKAKEIFIKYTPDLINELGISDYVHAINVKFALIAANEVLNQIPYINNTDKEISERVFWIYVIEEIKKL